MANLTTYTVRFGAYASDSFTGLAPLFTADDAFTYVVRDVIVACKNQEVGGRLEVGIEALTGIIVLLSLKAAVAGQAEHLETRQVLLANETLYAYSAIAPWSVVVTGYKLKKPDPAAAQLPAP